MEGERLYITAGAVGNQIRSSSCVAVAIMVIVVKRGDIFTSGLLYCNWQHALLSPLYTPHQVSAQAPE